VQCAVGAVLNPAAFFRAYLVGYLFFLGIAHGCFAVLMIYHLTGGAWGFLIRRILEAAMRTMPLLAILFLPIALGLDSLYLWARPEVVESMPELRHKAVYLNVPFFLVRAVVYFASWMVIAYFLDRWSREQDQTDDPLLARKLTRLSAAGLVVYGITITFAAVDWVMSLQPAFRSSIFGPVFASGELLTGLAFALVVFVWLAAPGSPVATPLTERAIPEVLNDLGNLLLTFLSVWAYVIFFQFLLIWIANLPYDVIWYLPRTEGGWRWVTMALIVLHFAVPFCLLLSRDVKQEPRALAALAGLILIMHLAYVCYQVLPAFAAEGPHAYWLNALTPLAVGGPWLALFLHELQARPIFPCHDVNEAAVGHLREREEEVHDA
jgi:hypothetical protein